MRRAVHVIDALRLCLCPRAALTIVRGLGFRQLSTYNAEPSGQPQQKPALLRHCQYSKGPTRPHRPFSTVACNKKDLQDDFFGQGNHTLAPASTQSTARALEQLKVASRVADYVQIHALVEYIVRILGRKPDVTVYEALILANANAQYGSAQEVAKLLEEMEEGNVVSNAGIYHAALRALAVHPDQLLRDEILRSLRGRWFTLSNEGRHDVVAGLIRERQLELALHWLEQMQKGKMTIYSWLYDMLVYSLCNVEEFDEALRIMHYRLQTGHTNLVPPNNIESQGAKAISESLWYHFLDTASRSMHHAAARFAYTARVETEYLNPPAGISSNILNLAAQNGDIRLATSVFNVLSKRPGSPIQLHHYEALIETYMNASDLPTAIALLATMHSAGHLPTSATTRPIFIYLKHRLRRARHALEVLEKRRNESSPVPLAAINVLIESFVFHRDLPSALYLYETLPMYSSPPTPSAPSAPLGPDVHTFNLLLRGCRGSGDKAKAMFLAAEMVALKVMPDALTYDRLVLVCCHCGQEHLDDAWRYVQEMREAGFLKEMRVGTARDLATRACLAKDTRLAMLGVEQGGILGKEEMQELQDSTVLGHESGGG